MLNKSCKHQGKSPLSVHVLNINMAFSFFQRVKRSSQWSLFRRMLALGTNDSNNPILEFLQLITQGNAESIPDGATVVKRRLRLKISSQYTLAVHIL